MTPVWAHHATDPVPYDAVRGFITRRIWGDDRQLPYGTAMAVLHDGVMVAGAIFYNYDPEAGTIELSAASDSKRWMSRPVLWEMFNYAFNDLGCQAVIMRCDPEDGKMCSIASRYGFDRFDLPRLRGRGKSEALFILGDDEWRANGFHRENGNG